MRDQGPDGEALLEVGVHRAVLFGRGQGASTLRDVSAHDFERRLTDEKLFVQRQIEEGERLVVTRPHERFVEPVPGDAEEADLPADLIDLTGDASTGRRTAGAKRCQIDDGEGTIAHVGLLFTERV